MPTYSFKLSKSFSGNFALSDRGTAADFYRSRVTIYDTKTTLDTLIDYIELQRQTSDTVSIDFSTDTEQIFGSDIDYTSALTVAVIEQGQVIQNTWKGYSLELLLHLQSPTFTGTATLPSLDYSRHNFVPGAVRTKRIGHSYENTILALENNSDYGVFKGTFFFSDSNAKNAKRFYATQRGTAFYLDEISGVDYLFGKKRKIMFPVKVRITDYKEFYATPGRWRVNIQFAEEV